ncbi:TPA: hypothetical protein NEG48_001090 [Elizabethkingia anophelis]|nr:hypothetical protein [Elizabethkingia anophelis]
MIARRAAGKKVFYIESLQAGKAAGESYSMNAVMMGCRSTNNPEFRQSSLADAYPES